MGEGRWGRGKEPQTGDDWKLFKKAPKLQDAVSSGTSTSRAEATVTTDQPGHTYTPVVGDRYSPRCAARAKRQHGHVLKGLPGRFMQRAALPIGTSLLHNRDLMTRLEEFKIALYELMASIEAACPMDGWEKRGGGAQEVQNPRCKWETQQDLFD